MTMKRREFLRTALSGGAAAIGGAPFVLRSTRAAAGRSQIADSRIEVLIGEPIGRIAPELYGHFVEHLGGVVYGGIWVGEDSKIPNIRGMRKSLVEALQRIKPSVIRWPGGCFADSYDWRDGIGPRANRPRRTNFWRGASEWPKGAPDTPWKYETNQFGTNEFARFCKLVGAQPYFAANLRSLNARDFYQWVEYCNAPPASTTLAEMREAAGDREPFSVKYWGVGNESWGCGGNFTPEEYASEYRRFTEWLPGFSVDLACIGAGPGGGEVEWTRRFFSKLAERRAIGRMWGWALHHYSWNVSGGRTGDWVKGKGDAVKYPVEEWYELLREAEQIEGLITSHWTAMGEFDRQHHVKLVVDEWGSWYRPGSEVDPTHLFGQQSTMRDAVLAGQTLNAFHRHAEKVGLASIAQLANCLQSLFLTHEEALLLTPTFHVFEMYAPHQGGQSLRTVVSSPRPSYTRNGQPASVQGLDGSASLQGRQLVLTVTNADAAQSRKAEITIRGGSPKEANITVLAASDIHAHNTFETPDAVKPRRAQAEGVRGSGLVFEFPAASVTRLSIELA